MSSSLSFLATEIIELIASFLEPAHLCSLRCVCRELNRKTLHRFGLTNFATVHTDLSRESLQRLLDISESEYFAMHVQCLHIRFTDDFKLGQGVDWRRHRKSLLVDRQDGTSLLRDVLVRRLLKCRSFYIYCFNEYPPTRETDYLIPSGAVGIILSLVSDASLALISLAVESDQDEIGRLDTQRLQMSLCYTPRFIAAWSHIEELSLKYVMTPDQHDWILHLISSTLRLRRLSLELWRQGASVMERLCHLRSLNTLEELSFGPGPVTVENISKLLLQNSGTLRSLSFRFTKIENGRWATVFKNIKGRVPRLQNLSLYWLIDRSSNGSVSFSEMTSSPVVPGPEDHGAGGNHLRHNSLLLESGDELVNVSNHVSEQKQKIEGFEYHGTRINNVLNALACSAETG